MWPHVTVTVGPLTWVPSVLLVVPLMSLVAKEIDAGSGAMPLSSLLNVHDFDIFDDYKPVIF